MLPCLVKSRLHFPQLQAAVSIFQTLLLHCSFWRALPRICDENNQSRFFITWRNYARTFATVYWPFTKRHVISMFADSRFWIWHADWKWRMYEKQPPRQLQCYLKIKPRQVCASVQTVQRHKLMKVSHNLKAMKRQNAICQPYVVMVFHYFLPYSFLTVSGRVYKSAMHDYMINLNFVTNCFFRRQLG